MNPAKYIIVVAGGKGERMGGSTPKQFLPLAGKPVLMHTIGLFHRYDPHMHIILVLPEAHREAWSVLCETYRFTIPHEVVAGGDTRFHSVKNALRLVPPGAIAGVHDGVRPLVSEAVVDRCFREAQTCPAVVPVLPVVESLRKLTPTGSEPADRQSFRIVQTPQVFQSSVLLKAYSAEYSDSFTDDASVVEPLAAIRLVDGNRENIKITTPEDLVIAEVFLNRQAGSTAD